tara:strand:- start:804 stop:1784 length:981 start_codon:yes stop_codon:yes gene_type:complete
LSNILRYPLEAPTPGNASTLFGEGATEAIDYVCFQRSKTSYDDGGYGGFSFPSSTGTAKREPNDKRVYMAMPKTLQTGFAPRYKQIDLGVMGAAALTAMNADLGGDMKELAQTISDAADAALPEFAAGAIAEVTNGLAQAGGLAGGLDASSIQALTKGRVFNPFKEQVFSGLDFRTHNFTFKLLSRTETEAKRVQDIINYFKFGALPSIGGTENSGGSDDGGTFASALSGLNSQRFFNVPDNFDIKFIRLKPDASGGTISTKDNDFMHFKIHPSVCTGIQINYTPDGQYTSFKSITGGMVQVPAIQLGLTFAELKLVTKGDIAKGF